MKQQIISTILFGLILLPLTWADNVTVHGSIGMLEGQLMTKTFEEVGTVNLWNTREDLNLVITPADGYLLSKVYIFISPEPPPPPPIEGETAYSEPNFGKWPYITKYKKVPTSDPYSLTLNFDENLDFEWGHWGARWLDKRVLTVGIRVELMSDAATPVTLTAWAFNPNLSVAAQRCGWGDNALAMRYEIQHPKHGQFIDTPVLGLNYETWTQEGTTAEGGFWYYPGEFITFSIGTVEIGFARASQQVTPLDVFPGADPSGAKVVNLARLLQSLDADGTNAGSIDVTDSAVFLEPAMTDTGMTQIDFGDTGAINTLIEKVVELGRAAGLPLFKVSAAEALVRMEQFLGTSRLRKNISKSPSYAVDKPKLDIMPVWVPARSANGTPANVEYMDAEGTLLGVRQKVKPLFVTYTEEQEPNLETGITRSGSDIITAVSMDDGATWKRFNVSQMARKSSITLKNGEKFPGDSRGPQQKIAADKILVLWTSAYARGGKPSFAIKTDDAYPHDDAYAVNDYWGVGGSQGSVNYDEDKDVGDQGIGEIPYYAVWACRGVLIWEGNVTKFPGHQIGDMVWFKPERLTSGRRDAFFVVAGRAKKVGFAAAWQEDPGGLLPGSCKGGGDGWSGATVHKKTDIWYSFIRYADFDQIDTQFDSTNPDHATDELGREDDHGAQTEIANRPKWLIPMSLPVRVSDNNTVNTDNLKVALDVDTGLPVIDPVTGAFIPDPGAAKDDAVAHEHEDDGNCGDDGGDDSDHGGQSGTGGGWGMARYAYLVPGLNLADQTDTSTVWDANVLGDYRPEDPDVRWYRFINKPGETKTVVVTADGRLLDGNTGACRPSLFVMPGGWAILGYEETKGLGIPPVGEHGDDTEVRPEFEDSGKNIIYHSFKFDSPDLVSSGNVLNLPALTDDGNLIPINYKDAAGEDTGILRQYKTENARRVRFIVQPKSWMGATRTSIVTIYKQGREGNGRPSDVFAIRGVVPSTDKGSDNPYRFSNLLRYETGAEAINTYDMIHRRGHINLSATTVESFHPIKVVGDNEGKTWRKVHGWNQYQGNLSDESFINPYSDAKAHRGFLRGDTLVFGYSFTPNWGVLGGDHMDFYLRRSFDAGQTWTTDPNGPEETTHTVIECDSHTDVVEQRQTVYHRGEFEPGRNMSLLSTNSHTVIDPRLVPPMGPGTINPTYPEDDKSNPNTFYIAFGTAKIITSAINPLLVIDTVKEDIFYSRTTDRGSTWLEVPWVVNPGSSGPNAGETLFDWPWLAQGTPLQGHAQIRMHPSGTRLYSVWHQEPGNIQEQGPPHDEANDIWFRRIDFIPANE